MEKIMPIGKEIYMHYNTPQNGAYMGFSFKKIIKLSWVKFSFYSAFFCNIIYVIHFNLFLLQIWMFESTGNLVMSKTDKKLCSNEREIMEWLFTLWKGLS